MLQDFLWLMTPASAAEVAAGYINNQTELLGIL